MFTELLNQSNKFISCYITEDEYYLFINDLIISNIINHDYISNLIKSNIFYQHKYNNILLLLSNLFISNLHLDKNSLFIWQITGLNNLILILNYLDKYPLQSKKYLQYFILRRTYKIIEKKEH